MAYPKTLKFQCISLLLSRLVYGNGSNLIVEELLISNVGNKLTIENFRIYLFCKNNNIQIIETDDCIYNTHIIPTKIENDERDEQGG